MKFTTIVILLGCTNQQECKQNFSEVHNQRDYGAIVSSSDFIDDQNKYVKKDLTTENE